MAEQIEDLNEKVTKLDVFNFSTAKLKQIFAKLTKYAVSRMNANMLNKLTLVLRRMLWT